MEAMTGTPHERGFRMPAEWAPHAATWLAWPHNAADWPGKFAAIPWVYTEIVRNLARVEDVHVLVNDAAAQKRAWSMLARSGAAMSHVHFHLWPTNRVWVRDSGPIFLTNQEKVAITNWKFNAWAKYDNWQLDDALPLQAADALELHAWTPTIRLADGREHRIVLEGGSIDVNGAGVLITTEECLLSPIQARNPGVTREELESAFHDYLGIEQVLWLNRGTAGDDTHGHVDDITRFVAENTIITVEEPNTADENHEPLEETSIASDRPAPSAAGITRSSPCPCPGRWSSRASASQPATRISTSPTTWYSCPPSTTPRTASPSRSWPSSSPAAKSPVFTAVT